MTPADVTVVIPAFDRAHAVQDAIDSVLAQTLPAARVVVVDDGSADGTADVVARNPVTLVRHDRPRGSGAARNTGIAAASTEWVAFLDSDDAWHPDHLATVVPALRRHAFVTTPMVDSLGRGRGNVSGRARLIAPADLFFPENVVCTSTTVARRDLMQAVGGFDDLKRAQDLDLFIRLLGVGTAVALAVPTATYTVPAAYQEDGLRARSLAGAEAVRSRYADRAWMTERLVRSIRTQLAWDDLRYAQHRRDPGAVLRSALALRPGPTTAAILRDTILHRRRARRFPAAGAR